MNKLNFNYKTKKVNESIGMSNEDYNIFATKLADKSLEIYQEGLTAGRIAEWIAENLSFTELIYMSTQFLCQTSIEAGKKVSELQDRIGGRKGLEDDGSIPKGIDDLKKFLKLLSNNTDQIKLTDNVSMHTIDLSNDNAKSDQLLEFLKSLSSSTKDKKKDPTTFEEIQKKLDERNDSRKSKEDE